MYRSVSSPTTTTPTFNSQFLNAPAELDLTPVAAQHAAVSVDETLDRRQRRRRRKARG